ncbi:MAG TPA: hypothetical protein VJN63_07265 [Thermoplasmata archaeon]|nr:hypothetical protein [Thermoplasmata archaeon]
MDEVSHKTERIVNYVSAGLDAGLDSTQDEAMIRRVLASLGAFGPEYLPDRFELTLVDTTRFEPVGGQVKPLNSDTVGDLAMALQTEQPGHALISKGSPASSSLMLSTRNKQFRAIRHDIVGFSVWRELAKTPPGRTRFLRASKAVFEACGAFFGDIGTPQLVLIGPPERGGQVVFGDHERGMPPPGWGMLLGREYVELLGIDRVRTAPCEVVEEFGDGHYLLLLDEDFLTLELDRDLLEVSRKELVDHFGPQYFSYVEKGPKKMVLPRFREPERAV